MIFDWYNLFSLTEFVATGLVARTLVVQLEDRGRLTFQITQANTTAVYYDGTFLPVSFLDQNPYIRDNYAVYLDADSNVWFGFEVDA